MIDLEITTAHRDCGRSRLLASAALRCGIHSGVEFFRIRPLRQILLPAFLHRRINGSLHCCELALFDILPSAVLHYRTSERSS